MLTPSNPRFLPYHRLVCVSTHSNFNTSITRVLFVTIDGINFLVKKKKNPIPDHPTVGPERVQRKYLFQAKHGKASSLNPAAMSTPRRVVGDTHSHGQWPTETCATYPPHQTQNGGGEGASQERGCWDPLGSASRLLCPGRTIVTQVCKVKCCKGWRHTHYLH